MQVSQGMGQVLSSQLQEEEEMRAAQKLLLTDEEMHGFLSTDKGYS